MQRYRMRQAYEIHQCGLPPRFKKAPRPEPCSTSYVANRYLGNLEYSERTCSLDLSALKLEAVRAACPPALSTLEATQGQQDGFFSQLPYKCYLADVVFVGNRLQINPQLDSRVEMTQIELFSSIHFALPTYMHTWCWQGKMASVPKHNLIYLTRVLGVVYALITLIMSSAASRGVH